MVLVAVVAFLILALRMPAVRHLGAFVLGPAVLAMVLVGLFLYTDAGPLVAAAIGRHRLGSGDFVFAHGGAAFTLMLVGALLLPVAVIVLAKTAAEEGKAVVLSMLVVGLIFLSVIAIGELTHWLRSRR